MHFWPAFSLLNGIRIDFLSPSIYFTDLLILILLIISFPKIRLSPKWAPLFVIIVLNIVVASSPLLTIYRWFKVLEFILLAVLLNSHRYLVTLIPKALSIAIIIVAVLALWQMVTGSSVGGLWQLLGERPLSVNTPGISKVEIFNHTYLRPYSTLPHPNALAGFALLSLVILMYLPPAKGFSFLAKICCILVISISFSRTALFALALYPLFKTVFSNRLKKMYILLLTVLALLLLHVRQGSSLTERIVYLAAFAQLLYSHWLLGVGLGNFIPSASSLLLLPSSSFKTLYAPIHNIFLLLLSETGFVFVATLIYLLKNYRQKLVVAVTTNQALLFGLSGIVVTGSFDHYWLTLQQNSLLLTVFIALLIIKSYPHVKS
jgi:hypothetical protein